LQPIRQALLEIRATLEAGIDFPDETTELNKEMICQKLETAVIAPIEKLIAAYENGHMIREGLRLVILGSPNVGKSSLMNRFLDKDRAIVTDVPGTTRDSIEETLNINGLPVVLVDTAGWHETHDPVEKIGIERTRKLAGDADLILFMVDAGTGLTPDDQDIYQLIIGNKLILLINKVDLLGQDAVFDLPSGWSELDWIRTSVKSGDGMDALKDRIFHFAIHNEETMGNQVVPTLRQKKLLETARTASVKALETIRKDPFLELASMELQVAVDAMEAVVGNHVSAHVLDEIFSRFCIGK